MKVVQNYMHEKIIDRLSKLNPNNVKLGLENISNLLSKLDNPHKRLSDFHIAVTHGKGTTAFFLSKIFKSAGYKTGLYLSPHLIDIRERIVIGSEWIPEERFVGLADYIFSIIEKEKLPVTFFEFVTALAFLYFFQEKIDIGIIEVGLGGRLDATNVLAPLACIITEIGLEHAQYLGSSIKEIALEKGGIIKPGSTLFVSSENSEAVETFEGIIRNKKATCFLYGKDFFSLKNGSFTIPQAFSLKFKNENLKNLKIETPGAYQVINSSTATATALYLREKFPLLNENSIRKGLRNCRISCRMELVHKSPQIVLDTAHNNQAVKALIKNIPCFFSYKRLIVILGILDDKDYKGMIQLLSSIANLFIVTEPKTERALPARLLLEEASALCKETHEEKEISKALNKAKEFASPQDLILVTGSFYTVGEALSELKKFKLHQF